MSNTDTTLKPSTHQSLPEISVLFNDTVTHFKKTALSFFILAIIQTVITVAIFVAVTIVAILVGAGTGIAKLSTLSTFDATQMADMLPGLAAGMGVFFVALIGVSLVLGPAFQASLILLLGKYEGKGEYGSVLKEGFKFIVPTLIASLVISFLVMGGFFLFIIPAFILAFLSSFTLFEVVLAGKKPIAALYSSVNLVSQHFWGVFGRLLLFVVANWGIFAVISIAQEAVRGSAIESLIVLLSVILNIALMPLSMIFNLVLYRQVKAASAEKDSKPTWIWIVSIVGWLLMLLLVFTIGRGLMDLIKTAENQAVSQNKDMDWSQLSSDEDSYGLGTNQDDLAADTFTAINEYRAENKLTPFTEDQQLCAYSQRRLQQLADFGGFDDHKGWYEDRVNQEVIKAYFSSYKNLGYVLFSPLDRTVTAQTIIDTWVNNEAKATKNSLVVTNPSYTRGCARNDETNMMFIGGY